MGTNQRRFPRLSRSATAKGAALGALVLVGMMVLPASSVYPVEFAFLPFVDEDCSDGPAQPLTTSDLVTALRESGITAQETDDHCTEEMVAEVTNVLFTGPDVGYDEITAREGHVICQVMAQPFGPPERRRSLEQAPLLRGPGTSFVLGNVDCAIYTQGDRSEVQVARLEGALTRLEDSLG